MVPLYIILNHDLLWSSLFACALLLMIVSSWPIGGFVSSGYFHYDRLVLLPLLKMGRLWCWCSWRGVKQPKTGTNWWITIFYDPAERYWIMVAHNMPSSRYWSKVLRGLRVWISNKAYVADRLFIQKGDKELIRVKHTHSWLPAVPFQNMPGLLSPGNGQKAHLS